MLNAAVLALGVLTHDDQVNLGIARGNGGQVANRAEVGKELKLLAQRHIDALKATADRRGHWTFQADPGALD